MRTSWPLLRATIDFAFPPACLLCREAVDESGFCDGCRRELFGSTSDVCRRCSAPVGPNLPTENGCVHCAGDRHTYSRVLAVGVYDGLMRSACRKAQSSHSPVLAKGLADVLMELWEGELRKAPPDVVVAIPQHWSTRFFRTHNTAEVIAGRVGGILKRSFDRHILRKVRRTPPQTSLTSTQRRNNLKGAFRLSRGVRLDGCRVLLVDDVLTTGTTAHRAAGVLRKGGAVDVTVAVIARGVGKERRIASV